MAVALTVVAGVVWYRGGMQVAEALAGTAAVFLVGGAALPRALGPVYGAWMCLARVLGWINTHLLLALVFYTLFTLVGGVMRVLRHDPLQRRLDRGRSTYWCRRGDDKPPRERLERQF